MKPGFLLLPFFALAISAKAQLGVGITTPDASAQLHVESSSKGVLVPRVTSTANVPTPAKGLLVYQTGGTEGFYYNSGTSASPNWVQVLAGNTAVALAPSTQQTSSSTNALINVKLVGSTGLGAAGTSSLVSLSASGTYLDGSTHDKERFRVDNDGSILAVSDYTGGAYSNAVPIEGSGTRFMWYGQKAAFRAGRIDGTQWDDANIGLFSTAIGDNVRALGDNALALGKNTVAANIGTIAMGEGCTATGANSVALGYGASTSTAAGSPRTGSFVFADRSVPLVYSFGSNVDVASQFHPTVTNSFNVRAVNGSYFYTNTALTTSFIFNSTTANLTLTNSKFTMASDGSSTLTSNSGGSAGVSLPAGGGSWNSLSDVNMKENFAVVDGEELLDRLRMVPITSWNYKTQDSKIRHIGPMAQDFAAAFNVGEDNRHIATIDPDGVALAGVQALDSRTNSQQLRIEELQKENAALKVRLERIEKLLGDK